MHSAEPCYQGKEKPREREAWAIEDVAIWAVTGCDEPWDDVKRGNCTRQGRRRENMKGKWL